ncbi:MAG: ATP-dependent nuclease [Desulfovibrio sp.]
MKICKITVENFRLLKEFSIDLEDELSLVIGKNNTGKTSLLTVLSKFLDKSGHIAFDDFNVDFKQYLYGLITEPQEADFFDKALGIKLRLFIQYNEEDDLSNLSSVMMDLDPESNIVVLGFEYLLKKGALTQARNDFEKFKESKSSDGCELICSFFKNNHSQYFEHDIKSIAYDKDKSEVVESDYISLKKEKISLDNILNFKFISARRGVSNKGNDRALSAQTSKMYKQMEETDKNAQAVAGFQLKLEKTDSELTEIYSGMFEDIVQKVGKFGGISDKDSVIKIVSSLQHKELLDENTTVTYQYCGESLPEHHNGLGYMNLISIIFQIELLRGEFKRSLEVKPADINLLFIEEPEAHTHPQMQYVFIKNIKTLLSSGVERPDGNNRPLQYVISSHSSHILAESEFDDIKYLKKESPSSVVAKNLKDLRKYYEKDGKEKEYRFLKQYLTLNRAELFFADKAILIEGDTERILLPAMMKKIDQEHKKDFLLSQNISIVEVGAHSHIYEKFIDFIGVDKYLIITDIDSYKWVPDCDADGVVKENKDGTPKSKKQACSALEEGDLFTSNYSLIHFYNGMDDLDFFINLERDGKIIKVQNGSISPNPKGNVMIIYQSEENGFYPRSFEDVFFAVNEAFLMDDGNEFCNLTNKWLVKYRRGEIGAYDLAINGVVKKPGLAIDILLNSQTDSAGNQFCNWEIPSYIKEGLEWLRK